MLDLTKNLSKEDETAVEDPLKLKKGTEGKETEEVPRTKGKSTVVKRSHHLLDLKISWEKL